MSNSSENEFDEREQLMANCEELLEYTFQDRDFLRKALTHSSRATTRLECNERMEFLGDAVLGMVICEYLYQKHPEHREGQLTQQKSRLVSRQTCTLVGNRLKLSELILVGKGLRSIPDSLVAAAVESIIAAIYLDGGFEAANEFVRRVFAPELEASDEPEAENFKSLLQEETQRDGTTVPRYVIVDHRGPDHAREFCVAVEIGDQQFEAAWGRSKKEAEQRAARSALENWQPADSADAAPTSADQSTATDVGT